MENETKKSKLTAKDILAKTGPGIIMAAAAVGTGTVTTSAILGARYEYGMIWMVILALFMRGIYMRSAYTAQVVLGMPILDCINKFYGKALCAIDERIQRIKERRTVGRTSALDRGDTRRVGTERPAYRGTEDAAQRISDLEREIKQREQSREYSSIKERLEAGRQSIAEREREAAKRKRHDRGMSR